MAHVSQKYWEAAQRHIAEITAEAFAKCNRSVLNSPAPTNGLYCPAVFDSWHCFNYTKAGTTGFASCLPLDIFDPTKKAHRYCEPNGTWQINAIKGAPWTNNSNCIRESSDIDVLTHNDIHIYVYLVGAILSIILLVTSLIIFGGFKQLRCDRVIIHQNLFTSLVFTAFSYILYYTLVALNADVQIHNPFWCQALHVLCQYFTITNFSWMFFESLYLHIIMTYALTTSKTTIKIIFCCAWGVPALITAVYAIVRVYVTGGLEDCWIHENGPVVYIIAAPIFVSLALNVIMLINMVRLIMTKLQQTPEAGQNRKAIKAVLILVPMFGLQFLVFPFRPAPDTDAFYAYLYIMAFLMSTQGTFVSIVFCFCNGEVRSLLRRKWHQHLLMSKRANRNMALTSSTFADPYSAVETKREATHSQKVKSTYNANDKDGLEMKPLTDENGKVASAKDVPV